MKQSVVLVVAIIAVILGAAGLYYGLSSKDMAAKIETRLSSIEQRMDKTDGDVAQTDGKIRALRDQVQSALATVNGDLQTIQAEIADLTTKQAKAATPASDKGQKAEKNEKTAKPADGMYTIKAGDTVGKLAKEFGVTKRSIMEANPTLEENKLRVGKKIKIP